MAGDSLRYWGRAPMPLMRTAHRFTVISRLLPAGAGAFLRGALVAVSIGVPAASVHAEPEFPSAQDVIAIVEVMGVDCVSKGFLTMDDIEQMRRNLPRHFHRATYAQYLASPAYARSEKLFREELAKDPVTQKGCEGLRYFGRAEPNNLLFAERGLDYPDKRER